MCGKETAQGWCVYTYSPVFGLIQQVSKEPDNWSSCTLIAHSGQTWLRNVHGFCQKMHMAAKAFVPFVREAE